MKSLVDSLIPVYGLREARAVVRAVLEDAFGLSYTQQCLSGISTLTSNQREELSVIMHRLAKGEPMQYVLGQASFCGLALHVSRATLIPRPETEWLVASALLLQGVGDRVLDIGTGSGCIAIAIAKSRPELEVWACDISDEALAVARQNAEENCVNVHFFHADIFSQQFAVPGSRFSIIISNPPYVCQSEANEMSSWVLDHEPHMALFVPDEDPLLFYRAIARHGQSLLCKGGRLMLECNTRFAGDVAQMLTQMGYGDASVHHDMFNRPRFVTARL